MSKYNVGRGVRFQGLSVIQKNKKNKKTLRKSDLSAILQDWYTITAVVKHETHVMKLESHKRMVETLSQIVTLANEHLHCMRI